MEMMWIKCGLKKAMCYEMLDFAKMSLYGGWRKAYPPYYFVGVSGYWITPFSVTIAVTSSAGVTSKTGFQA